MLGPNERLTLFDALRPPAGFELDQAVATTFSLHLDFVAATLVALCGFGEPRPSVSTDPGTSGQAPRGSTEGAGTDEPIELIEAVRRASGRLTVFAQTGQIAARRGRLVHAWLEDVIHPVWPITPDRVFHPKLWALRFRRDNDTLFRLLCCTRNLTFDTSWDAMVQLDGKPGNGTVTQAGLGRMISGLCDLPPHHLDAARRSKIVSLADELAAAEWELPSGATALTFHPLGLEFGEPADPIGASHTRALVVSPFITSTRLASIASSGADHVLVTRPAAAAQVGSGGLGAYDTYALDTNFDLPDDGDNEGAVDAGDQADSRSAIDITETEYADPATELQGLHAKIYVLEHQKQSTRLLIGSANATNAAFAGNVEVLTEFSFTRKELSIDGVLDGIGERGLRSLLTRINVGENPTTATSAELLANEIDRLRRIIAQRVVDGTVTAGDDSYRMELSVDLTQIELPGGTLEVRCWPISLLENASAQPLRPGAANKVAFELSFRGLTRFLAVRATGTLGDDEASTTFVMPSALIGLPPDRSDRLLAEMLRDPDRFMRYLMMLLSDPDSIFDGQGAVAGGFAGAFDVDERLPPIFEVLMRAVARHPHRLRDVGRLVKQLEVGGHEVLPPGWDKIWPPIHSAMNDNGKSSR